LLIGEKIMAPYAVQSPTNPMRGLQRGGLTGYSWGALTPIAIAASPTGLVRAASGIVTLNTLAAAAHNFVAGEVVTLADAGPAGGGLITSVGGTRFGGNYMIQAVPSTSSLTLLPLDEVILHQPADTGGGGSATSIAAETPTPPAGGKAFALTNIGDQSQSPWGFFVDGVFLAAPGAFEVDVQVAAVDADSQYQTIANGNVTLIDATNQTFHFDATWTGAKFVRLFLRSRTNAVGLIGRIRG